MLFRSYCAFIAPLLCLIKEPGITCIVVVIASLLYFGKEEFHISLPLYCASIAPSKRALIDWYCGGYCALSVWLKTANSYFLAPLLRLYCALLLSLKSTLEISRFF